MNGHPTADIEAYLDGALPSTRMREVGQHLAGCATCRNELARAKRLHDRLSATLSAVAPTHLPALAATSARRSVWSLPGLRLAGALAAVLVMAIVWQMASPGLLQAAPPKLVARVPDWGGHEVTIYSNGNVFVGQTKLAPELAAPVRDAFAPQGKPVAQSRSASAVRLLQPKLADTGAIEPPRELAWSGPTSAPYIVAVERLVDGQWHAASGFPRTVNGFSTDLPAMQAGEQCRWRVVSGVGSGTDWVYLRVLSTQERGRLADAQRDFGEESPVYGSLCASLGLLSKAEEAFAEQVSRHPNDAGYRQALQAVRVRMGSKD